ncbi:MAG: hypothetical protein GC182_08895 [Rhodopseudomonas sp.]|nr:hypothetical protein [Rhodopseudomonas sp.]
MALTAATIMTLAGRNLQDEDAVRWTLPELVDWINEAVRSIVLAKPSANSTTVLLALNAGTLQSIGDGNLALLRLVRNITAAGPPRQGGRMIRVTARDALDAEAPDWHDPDRTPYKKEVRQFVYDEEDPTSFYTYPGNDGTGLVEAVVSKLPAAVAATGDVNALASYDIAIGLQDVYQAPILDYVLFRALSKDDPAASPAGAGMHYQAFAAAVGLKIKVESSNSPNSRAKVAAT